MTYTELRAAIAANLTDQAALIALLTAENVRTVAACAPGVGVETAYVQDQALSAYQAGVIVAEGMYDPKSSPRTVDQVLAWFAPANIYAAQVYARIFNALDNAKVTTFEFFDAVDNVANQIEPQQC